MEQLCYRFNAVSSERGDPLVDFCALGAASAFSCPPEETQFVNWLQGDTAEMAQDHIYPLNNFVPQPLIFLLMFIVFSAILLGVYNNFQKYCLSECVMTVL